MMNSSRIRAGTVLSSMGIAMLAACSAGAPPPDDGKVGQTGQAIAVDTAPPANGARVIRSHAMPVRRGGKDFTQAMADAGTDAGVPNLVYNGGHVLQNVKIYAVNWTVNVDARLQANIGNFYKDALSGPYMDWLSEYSTIGLKDPMGVAGSNQGIGRGTYGGAYNITTPVKCAGTAACMLTEADILTELVTQVQANAIPGPSVGCDGQPNELYMFDFPPNVTIKGTDGSVSCVQWCGVHGSAQLTINGAPITVAYGFHPDFFTGPCNSGCGNDTNPLNNATATHAHEIIEAVTDTDVELYNQMVSGVRVGWYSDAPNTVGEIADLCNDPGTIPCNGANCPTGATTWTVNPGWSDQAGACVSSRPNLPVICTGPGVPAGCRPCNCADNGGACNGATPVCDTTAASPTLNQCISAGSVDAGGGDDAAAGAEGGTTGDAGMDSDAAVGMDASAPADAATPGTDAATPGDSGAITTPVDGSTPGADGGAVTTSVITPSGCAMASPGKGTSSAGLIGFGALALIGAARSRRRNKAATK